MFLHNIVYYFCKLHQLSIYEIRLLQKLKGRNNFFLKGVASTKKVGNHCYTLLKNFSFPKVWLVYD